MRYAALLSYAASNLWAVDEAFGQMWLALLTARVSGLDDPGFQAKAISDTRATAIRRTDGGVGVLPIMGPISQRLTGMDALCGGGASTTALATEFRGLMADPSVKAIIAQYDSPGGTVAGVQELAAEMAAARGSKPIIAQIDSMAASAAYWLASAADEIVITPSGTAGSIGVYTIHTDQSQKLAAEGIKPTLIKGAKGVNKAEGAPFEPLSDETHAFIQQRVNETENAFHKAIATNRGVTQAQVVDRFGKGRSFGAEESVDRGLADRVGTMDETLARYAGKVAGAPNSGGSERKSAMAMSFAAGGMPTVREFQAHLREQGASKMKAAMIASAASSVLRMDGSATAIDDATRRELRAITEELQARNS